MNLRDINAAAATPSFVGLSNLRNLTLNFDAAPITMSAATLSGNLNLTAHGSISENGAIIANSGTTTLTETLAGSDILLSSQANDFGASAIILSGTQSNIRDFDIRNINSGATTSVLSGLTSLRNLILSYDAAPIVVPTVTLSGNMSLTAHGNITQAGVITANAGTTTLTETLAGSDILLNTQANDFGTSAIVFGGTQSNIRDFALRNINSGAVTPILSGLTSLRNLTLSYDAAPIVAPTVTLSGNMNLTAHGNISETGVITANAGTTTLTETLAASDILLSSQANDFGTSAIVFGGTESNIRDFDLRNINSGATTPVLSGLTSLRNLILSYDAAPIVVPTVTLSGNMSLTAHGNITQSGVITANAGTTTLSETLAASDILLNTQANDFGATALVFSGTQSNIRDVAIRNINSAAATPSFTSLTNLRNLTLQFDNAGITFSAVTLTNSGILSATAGGVITQTGAITVPGTASFTAGGNAITLTQGNSFTGAITLSNSGTNNVILENSIATILAASTVGQNLTVTSSGAITQTGALTVPGASSFSASTNPITLTQSNNFTGAVSLSNSSTNNVSVTNSGALVIGASSIGQNLSLIAGGTISESGVITATGGTTTVAVTAPTSDILLGTQANNFGTSALVFSGTQADIRDVSLRNINVGAVLPSFTGLSNLRNLTVIFNNNAVVLPGLTMTGNLTVTAGGAITQTGADSGVTLTTSSVGGTLLNSANVFTNFNGVNTTSGDIQFTNSASPLTITGINETGGGNILINNTGSITNSGAINTAANGNITLNASGTETLGSTVTAGGSGGVILSASGGSSDILVNANIGSTSGAISATAGRNVTLNVGNISSSGNISLTGGSAISEAGAGIINGALLTTNSVGGTALTNVNTVTSLNATNATSGNITLTNNASTLTITSINQSVGNLTISNAGSIAQSGAIVVSGTPTFTVTVPTSDILLSSAANNFSTTPVVTNNGDIRDLALRNIAATAVIPTLPAGLRNLTILFDNAAISLPAVTLTGNLTATAGATITQTGADSGLTLTTSSIGGTLLNSANVFTNFNGINTTSGDIQFTNTASPLTISGINETGSGNILINNTGGITSSGTISTAANGNIILNASGTETLGSAVTAGGSGGVILSATGGSSDILLNATVSSTSGLIGLTAGRNVALNAGSISTSNNISLAGGGTISESGAGILNGALLTTNSVGGSALTNANTVTSFNATNATSGAISLTNSATPLTITGISQPVGNLTISNAGSITQSGAIVVSGTPSFTVTVPTSDVLLASAANNFSTTPVITNNGDIRDLALRNIAATAIVPILPTGLRNLTILFDNAAISLPAVTLTGSLIATSGEAISQTGADAGVTLTTSSIGGTTLNSANMFTNFNGLNTTSGDIQFTNSASPLTITGISETGGGSILINNTGGITTGGSISTAANGNITLNGSGTETLGSMVTAGGSGGVTLSAAGSSSDILVNTNVGSTSGAISATAGRNVTLNAGSIGTSGNISLTGGGTVSETGVGILNGALLSTNSGLGTSLTNANTITSLNAANTTSGNISLTNTANPLTITGMTELGGGNILINNSGGITTSGAVSTAANGVITLNASGTETFGSTVTAGGSGVITLSASGSLSDIIFNANVGSTSGSIGITAGRNITLNSGSLTTSNNVTLTATNGAISESGAGLISSSLLTTSSVGGTTLNNANAVTSFNGTNITSGDMSLNVTGALNIDAISEAVGNLSITSVGNITQSSTIIDSGTTTFNAGSSGDITLNSTSNEFNILTVANAHSLSVQDINNLTLSAINVVSNINAVGAGNLSTTGLLQTAGGNVNLSTTGAGTITIGSSGIKTSLNQISNGGNVTITATNTAALNPSVIINGSINTQGGSGGTYTLGGGVQVNVSPTVGAGNITLSGNTNSVIIGNITYTLPTTITVNAADIIINGFVQTTGTGLLEFFADSNNAGTGGVRVTSTGQIVSGGDLTIIGSNLYVNPGVSIELQSGSVIQAAGTLSLLGNVGSNNIVINRNIQSTAASQPVIVTPAGTGQIMLGGNVTTNGGNINLNNVVNITATTTLTSGGGSINIPGAINGDGQILNLSANSGTDISLTNVNNDFGTVAILSGNNVSLVNSETLDLGASNISGTLSVTAGGNITQSGVLDVTGVPTFTSTVANSDISLASFANNLSATPVITNNGNILDFALRNASASASVPSLPSGLRNLTLTFDDAAMVIPGVTLTGNLTATANGDISESGPIIANQGTTTIALTAAGLNILLGTEANDFGTSAIVFGGTQSNIQDVAIRNINNGAILPNFSSLSNLRNLTIIFDAVPITLPAITLTNSGNLSITAGGAIAQAGILTVPGTASFNAGANQITLTNVSNSFTGAVSLSNSGVNDVALTNSIELILGNVTVGTGALTLNGLGITQSVGTAITQASAAGNASFTGNAGLINLSNAGNSFTGSVLVSNTGANDVQLTNSLPLIMGTSNIGSGNVTLTSGGSITETGPITTETSSNLITFTVTTPLSDILLTQANDLNGYLNIGGDASNVRDITLFDKGPNGGEVVDFPALTNLRNLTVTVNVDASLPQITLHNGGSLYVDTSGTLTGGIGGSITQTDVIVVPGTTTLIAGNHPITLTDSNSLTGMVSLSNTGNNDVALTNSIALTLGNVTVGTGALTLNGLGITQSVGTAITQANNAGNASFTGNAGLINLSNAGNSFTGSVLLSNTGANDVQLTNSLPLIMGTSNIGSGNVTLTSGGSITETGPITTETSSNLITFTVTTPLSDILLTQANDLNGYLNIGGDASNVRDITLFDKGPNGGEVVDFPALTNLRNLTVTVNVDAPLPQITLHNGGSLYVDTSGILTGGIGGSITQTDVIVVPGTTTLIAGNHPITLTDSNSLTGMVSLSNTGNNDVALTNSIALTLGNVTVGTGALTLNGLGITQAASTTITQASGAGNASFFANAGVIDLANTGNSFTGSVLLNNTGMNDVSIANNSALRLEHLT